MASELIVQTLKGPTSGANAGKVIVPSGHTLDITQATVAGMPRPVFTLRDVNNATQLGASISYHNVTPLDTHDLSTLVTSDTIAVILYVQYLHNGGANHGYWTADFYQEGEANYGAYSESHYNDYYNTSWSTIFVPWNPENASTNLKVQTVNSYNTSSSNTYQIRFGGIMEYKA